MSALSTRTTTILVGHDSEPVLAIPAAAEGVSDVGDAVAFGDAQRVRFFTEVRLARGPAATGAVWGDRRARRRA
jgi:hypothetical protein